MLAHLMRKLKDIELILKLKDIAIVASQYM